MLMTSNRVLLNLQLFADGGDGGAGAGVSGSAAGNDGDSGDLSNVQYGIGFGAAAEEESAKPDEEAAAEDFDSLIKGRYKADYDARVQDIVQKRVRGMQGTVDAYNKVTPLIEAMAQRYGIQDTSDLDAIIAAFDEDTSLLEAEAEEKNIPVEQLKSMKKLERENAVLRNKQLQADRDRAAQQTVQLWEQQAEEARKIYPELDLNVEIRNPEFANLLRNNVSVKAAYQVIHGDDIMAAGMQYATRQAEQKVARSVAAGAKRPAEGGNGSGVAAIHKTDVSALTKNDMKEIYSRVMRGERISFG